MKRAVITGAAHGIGKALAHRFAQAGYTITGVDIDAAGAARVERELDARFVIADLRSEADTARVISELLHGKPIDVLIHNAGINAVGRFSKISIEAQEQLIAVNFYAPMLITAALLKADLISKRRVHSLHLLPLPLHELSGCCNLCRDQKRIGLLCTKFIPRSRAAEYSRHDSFPRPNTHSPCAASQPAQHTRRKTHATRNIGAPHLSRRT